MVIGVWRCFYGVFTVFSRCFYGSHGVYGEFTVFTVFPRYLINGIFSGIFGGISSMFIQITVSLFQAVFFSSYSETSIS